MTRGIRLAMAAVFCLVVLPVAAASANTGEWNDSTYVTIAGGKQWTRSRNVMLTLCGYNNHPYAAPNLVYLDRYAVANSPHELTDLRPYMDGNRLSTWGLEFERAWRLSAGDGSKTVYAQFTARAVGEPIDEPVSPVVSDDITLDTHGPRTAALKAVSVQKGKSAKLRFRITDNLSPRTRVTIRVCNASGRVLKTLRVGERRTGRAWVKTFRCNLDPGSYRYLVYARDLAGNPQSKVGSNRLVVTAPPPRPVAPVIKVGITETGECYHRLTCYWWLKHPAGNSVVTLAQAKAMGYRPCSVCKPPQ